ncbi:MAG: hypothetical protein HYX51_08070 [Chloroflexi bacterium]|nr:hypothetical protein [Chloroflexota bacterium]
MESGWEELEQLCNELREAAETWSERRSRIDAERQAIQPVIDQLEQHYTALAVEPALEQVREHVLGGAGMRQRMHSTYGLERLAALWWPAAVDPRPDLATAEGEYRIEVWLGVSEQGRPRVRIVGERRLEAALPVSVEKFRSALLTAVRRPAFVPYAHEDASSHPAADEPSEEAETPRQPGATDSSGEESAIVEDAGAPSASDQPAPPADDEPIAMGPASPA